MEDRMDDHMEQRGMDRLLEGVNELQSLHGAVICSYPYALF
jgi:hypothetical protein